MFKKAMFFCVFAVCLVSSAALSAPTVRQLGGKTQSSGANIDQVRRANAGRSVGFTGSRARSTNSVSQPTETASETQNSVARTPIANIMNTSRLKGVTGQNTKPTSGTTNKPSDTVTSTELQTINEKIDALESQVESQANSMITDTVSETGNYVTDVSVDGTKIKVEKTNLLLAPVRSADSDTITGDAEIWIVK